MELDSPVDFGLWGYISHGKAAKFRSWVSKDLGISEMAAHQKFGASVRDSDLIQFHRGYGWLEVPLLLEEVPDFIIKQSVKISVSDINPEKGANYCEIHSLYHGKGVCPVCSGNIIHRGRRST